MAMTERKLTLMILRQEREITEKHIVGTMGAIARLNATKATDVDTWAAVRGLYVDLQGTQRCLGAIERAMARYERQPEDVVSFSVYA
jgi:hypothetical protein